MICLTAIMGAREVQAKNLADFLVANANGKPIVIHGKAYKPDVISWVK